MKNRLIRKFRDYKMSVRMKLTLGLGAIAAMLLLSSIITIIEYGKLNSYLSDLITANVRNINVTQELSLMSDEYDMMILAAIGNDTLSVVPAFDPEEFTGRCDSLKASLLYDDAIRLVDSVLVSFSEFNEVASELETVIFSDFIDSRGWYFNRLQPEFNALKTDIDRLDDSIYRDMKDNSITFQDGFYRSIMPGIVSVGAGLVLVFLLLFFITVYYLNPLYKMLSSMDSYRSTGHRYTCSFEGNDELARLNDGIREVTEENMELRRRNKALREGSQNSES